MSEARSRAFVEESVPQAYERHLVGPLFEPWARELLRRAGPLQGDAVLDVACGPGTVALLAARLVGAQGRVVASDISPAMLELAATAPIEPGSARVEVVECSADELPTAEASFELVLCQQGLQFFPDRPGALRELRRVLAPGGSAFLSTWAVERPLGLFGPMAEAMRGAGVAEPVPGAFDPRSFALGAAELGELLEAAGFDEVGLETVELDCTWESGEDAIAAIAGTPYGPVLAALPPATQAAVREGLRERLGAAGSGGVSVRTVSHIAHGMR